MCQRPVRELLLPCPPGYTKMRPPDCRHIVVWLRSLGLGKYEVAFRENQAQWKAEADFLAEPYKAPSRALTWR